MGVGSQKLLSFLLATTALSDIVHAVADVFADALLTGEAEGFAIDATGVTATPAYVGAPEGGYVSIKEYDSPAALMSNVPLDDPRSPLVQSGTSPKLVRYHSDNGDSPGSDYPLMRWTPHNYAIRSQDLGTGWTTTGNAVITTEQTTAPDGTSTADKIANGAVPASDFVTSPASGTLSSTAEVYTDSIYLKTVDATWVRYGITGNGGSGADTWVNVATGATGTATAVGGAGVHISLTSTAVGNGWYRFAWTGQIGSASTSTITLTIVTADNGTTRDASKSCYVWGHQLVKGYNANPYLVTTTAARIGIPQAYDTDAGQYGILIEKAATNLLLRSEEISNASWTKTDNTITADNIAAPDGATTADLATEGSAGTAAATQAITITGNATYTISFFFKRGNTNWVRVALYETATSANRVSNWFNLSTGAMGTPANGGTGSGATGTITSVGDGWYRCVLTGAVNNAATAVTVEISSASTDGSTTRVNGATYYPWGTQAETGSFATSYIPTIAATATRAMDDVTGLITAIPFNATTGSYWAHAKCPDATNGGQTFGLNNDDTAERINCVAAPGLVLNLIVTDGGVTQVNTNTGSWTANTTYGIAIKYAANNFNVAGNGTLGTADTSGTVPTPTQFEIGARSAGGTPAGHINGFVYKIVYVPRFYSDAELQSKSTP